MTAVDKSAFEEEIVFSNRGNIKDKILKGFISKDKGQKHLKGQGSHVGRLKSLTEGVLDTRYFIFLIS